MGCDLARTEPLSGTVGRQTQFQRLEVSLLPLAEGEVIFPNLISLRGLGTCRGYFLELVGKEQGLVFRTWDLRAMIISSFQVRTPWVLERRLALKSTMPSQVPRLGLNGSHIVSFF